MKYTIEGKGEHAKVVFPEGNTLTLSRLDIEAIGLKRDVTPDSTQYNVIIITSNSVKKVQASITEKLELVGFTFDNITEAIAFKDLLILALWGRGVDNG